MTNRFLKKYLKKRSTELMLVMGILLFILQTTPVHCGECLIGKCRQTSSVYVSSGDVGCHKPIQEKKCCPSESREELKIPESVMENCPSCNCILTGAIDDQKKATFTSSVPLSISFVSAFPDSLYNYLSFSSNHHLVLSQPKVRSNPIFVLNSTYLI